ncbi:MAG: DUF192 domain-containing protein, partial [Desulfomonilaceae bacterium]
MSTSMRRATVTIPLLVVFAALAAFFGLSQVARAEDQMNPNPQPRTISITLGNQTISAVVADTDASRREGLLGWGHITEETGMLLDFAMEGQYAIHMQGMKFPIDAVWIDANGLIKLIYDDITPNSGLIYPSMFPSRYCLEIKAGFC